MPWLVSSQVDFLSSSPSQRECERTSFSFYCSVRDLLPVWRLEEQRKHGDVQLAGRASRLPPRGGAAVRRGPRPPGLRLLSAASLLRQRAQSPALQLLLLQRGGAAPERGRALRPAAQSWL
ncbi:hypothetical protein KUCAC02_034447 [Chaenocephalus aceratus]|nr:hypothetical protein KUCAC02_034447 [Chaenocephalus aceratus]